MKLIPKNQRFFYTVMAAFIIAAAVLISVNKLQNPQYQTTQAAEPDMMYDYSGNDY